MAINLSLGKYKTLLFPHPSLTHEVLSVSYYKSMCALNNRINKVYGLKDTRNLISSRTALFFSSSLARSLWNYQTTIITCKYQGWANTVNAEIAAKKYFRGTSHMWSFVKIKLSRNGEITLLFSDIGKSCPNREFLMSQICLKAFNVGI